MNFEPTPRLAWRDAADARLVEHGLPILGVSLHLLCLFAAKNFRDNSHLARRYFAALTAIFWRRCVVRSLDSLLRTAMA